VEIIRQRYLIEGYRGKVSVDKLEFRTVVRAMDQVAARSFGKMRRPGLTIVVSPVTVKEKA
jgi:hypothetical protein